MEIELCGYKVLIDKEDYEKLSRYKWSIKCCTHSSCKNVYFVSNKKDDFGKFRTVLLHREIMGLKTGDVGVVDHLSGNTLDNRKSNLRICTIKENTRNQKRRANNTSGYKGVSWCKDRNKWSASIKTDDRHVFIGRFTDIKDAYEAYCEASKKYHGEFGRTE